MINLKASPKSEEKYTDCKVTSVTMGKEAKTLNYIHLSSPSENQPIIISVQNSYDNILYQLKELKEGKRKKCYFAKGMTNIDIIKDEESKSLYITKSAIDESVYSYQLLSFNEIEEIITRMEKV